MRKIAIALILFQLIGCAKTARIIHNHNETNRLKHEAERNHEDAIFWNAVAVVVGATLLISTIIFTHKIIKLEEKVEEIEGKQAKFKHVDTATSPSQQEASEGLADDQSILSPASFTDYQKAVAKDIDELKKTQQQLRSKHMELANEFTEYQSYAANRRSEISEEEARDIFNIRKEQTALEDQQKDLQQKQIDLQETQSTLLEQQVDLLNQHNAFIRECRAQQVALRTDFRDKQNELRTEFGKSLASLAKDISILDEAHQHLQVDQDALSIGLNELQDGQRCLKYELKKCKANKKT